jgi:hypothetical protein
VLTGAVIKNVVVTDLEPDGNYRVMDKYSYEVKDNALRLKQAAKAAGFDATIKTIG